MGRGGGVKEGNRDQGGSRGGVASFVVLNRITRERLSKDRRMGESEPAGYGGRSGPGLLEAQQGGRCGWSGGSLEPRVQQETGQSTEDWRGGTLLRALQPFTLSEMGEP